MRVILDTNVLLVSLPRHSQFRPIYDALREGKFELGVSTNILLECEEVFTKKNGLVHTDFVFKELENLDNIFKQNIHFHWNLIHSDPDDNIFSDCAFAFRADYLVTNDSDFNVLKKVDFPKVNVINADQFLEILKQSDPT
ncbi:MAG: putative toxin-antitoxin system toxin component, PIN family [Saprospiraceae bacterium]|nr:putative toxin-antitoxin system toxin component, PIN family [Saprospiraceae bacterium]